MQGPNNCFSINEKYSYDDDHMKERGMDMKYSTRHIEHKCVSENLKCVSFHFGDVTIYEGIKLSLCLTN
jgi:hypothetical protein